MLQSVETPHLFGRKVEENDVSDLYRLNSDPDVAKTMGFIRTKEQTRDRLQIWLDDWKQHGYGVWIFHDKITGKFVGRAGLQHYLIDEKDEIELLYALMPEFWNKGLATEMGHGIIQLAFQEYKLSSLVCFTLPENKASLRVIEKLGFVYEKDIMHVHLQHRLHRLHPN